MKEYRQLRVTESKNESNIICETMRYRERERENKIGKPKPKGNNAVEG